MLNTLRERSRRTRLLLSKQFGVDSHDGLSRLLGNNHSRSLRSRNHRERMKCNQIASSSNVHNSSLYGPHHERCINNDSTSESASNAFEPLKSNANTSGHRSETSHNQSVPGHSSTVPDIHQSSFNHSNEETDSFSSVKSSSSDMFHVYTDSSTFLKGTQSANPHNDYCQNFVDTGHRPQNYIRDVGLSDRFEEYPKLKELIRLKDSLIASTASPPMYLKVDLKDDDFSLTNLNGKFDVILIEPPLEEYTRNGLVNTDLRNQKSYWTWQEIMALPIGSIAAQRSFIFMWVGSSEGLDEGRVCLKKWGFRRCEDICWIKTNKCNRSKSALDSKAFFQRTKEHCLMGIKGTVRRSTDGDFIHANVDIDLIITEEPPLGCTEKPSELFNIIEHFCLGRRRLHLFGRDSTIRPGWLTLGSELTHSNFNADTYWSFFENNYLTGCTERIESLRPKSPPPKNKNNHISQTHSLTISPSVNTGALPPLFNSPAITVDMRGASSVVNSNARMPIGVKNRLAN